MGLRVPLPARNGYFENDETQSDGKAIVLERGGIWNTPSCRTINYSY